MRTPRSLAWLMPLLAVAGCQCRLFLPPEDRAPVKVAATLSFPETFVGARVERPLTITNPGKLARSLSITLEGPFEADAEVKLDGAQTIELKVTFAPLEAADVKGRLLIRDVEEEQTRIVQLSGRALAVPLCRIDDECRPRRFDMAKADCVEAVADDGTPCTSPFACFARATCVSGVCRGSTVSCDDGIRCTEDVCGATGCGQVDGTPTCPAATMPCQVPSCSEASGCTVSNVPDGTPCGPRTCTTARVCVGGSCDSVTPVKTQACASVLVGVPAGAGWADGRGAAARFSSPFAIAVEGEVAYVTEEDVLRRVTLSGETTTLAGRFNSVLPNQPRDGFGARARLGTRSGVALTSVPGQLLLLDGASLRSFSHGGLLTTLIPAQSMTLSVGDGVGRRATVSGERLVATSGGRSAMAVVDGPCSIGGCSAPDAGQLLYREVSARGEAQTVARIALEALSGWDPSAQVVTAFAPTREVVCARATSGAMVREWRLNVLRDGGLGEVMGGACPLREFPVVGGRVEARAEQLREEGSGLVRWAVDAGGLRDGPVGQASVLDVKDGDRDADGGLWFIDGQTIRRLHHGVITTLAGPIPDRRLVDGTPDVARVAGIGGLSLHTDAVFFVDPTEKVLRRMAVAGSAVSTIGVRPAPGSPRDGALGVASFKAPSATVLHQGQVLVDDEDASGARTLRAVDPSTLSTVTRARLPTTVQGRLESSGTSLWGRAAPGGVREVFLDGGVSAPVLPMLVVADFVATGGTSFLIAGASSGDPLPTQLFRADATGTVSPLAGRPSTDGVEFLAGPAATARLGVIARVRLARDGTVYWSQRDENAINALSPQGIVRRVVELADAPIDFVVEPAGTLLVAVDAALLRVTP